MAKEYFERNIIVRVIDHTYKTSQYDAKLLADTLNSLPGSFSLTFVELMKRRGLTMEKLSERSEVSMETIGRLRRCEECNSSLETLIAICIGMNLHPLLSADLLRKAGKAFQINPKHVLYYMILHEFWQKPLSEANDFLQRNGVKPLSRIN